MSNRKASSSLVAGIVIAVLVIVGLVNAVGNDDAPAPTTSTDYVVPRIPTQSASDVSAGTATVPNVVGMNHQAAQDLLQAAGFYLLLEQDATGQGRMLVLDRNWQVVAQSVKGGTTVPTDTLITLSSKKIGE